MTATAIAGPACPTCGGEMYDNRATKKNPRQTDFKCKAYKEGCEGVIWPPKTGSAPTTGVRPAPQSIPRMAGLNRGVATVNESGDRLGDRLPLFDKDDPASLESWFGNYGYAEPLRKVVLANCKEIVRARYTLANEKVSETRLDDLSRLHDNYLDFLVRCLEGRKAREEMIRGQIGV